jgi:hypothetical protein
MSENVGASTSPRPVQGKLYLYILYIPFFFHFLRIYSEAGFERKYKINKLNKPLENSPDNFTIGPLCDLSAGVEQAVESAWRRASPAIHSYCHVTE